MDKDIHEPSRDYFADAFMQAWQSPGIGIRKSDYVWGAFFDITEQKTAWKVTIKGISRRRSNLYAVGCLLFDELFDEEYVFQNARSGRLMRRGLNKIVLGVNRNEERRVN